MKRKRINHPKLYLEIIFNDSKSFITFVSNRFDEKGNRVIENESIENDIFSEDTTSYLIRENTKQLEILIKFLRIQKIVLDKYKKVGNYDTVKVVENSIETMNEFKKEFDDWFNGIENEL